MIFIQKGEENPRLTNLRTRCAAQGLTPKKSYEKLRGRLKNAIRQQLLEEQGHLCAYCMCQIPRADVPENVAPVIIEHFYPRSPIDGSDIGQGLAYSNLLAVCHGNRGGTAGGKEQLTCDAHKENEELHKVNPCDAATLQTIYYEMDGEIHADDPDIEKDLVEVLNLNAPQSPLISERKRALMQLMQDMASLPDSELEAYCTKILNGFQNETDPKTPYAGILIYYLQTLLAAITNKEK